MRLRLAVIGLMIVLIGLGSVFYRALIVRSYWILMLGILLILIEVPTLLKKQTPAALASIIVGALLLALVLGLQNPQLTFTPVFILLGVGLIIPAAVSLLHKR